MSFKTKLKEQVDKLIIKKCFHSLIVVNAIKKTAFRILFVRNQVRSSTADSRYLQLSRSSAVGSADM